MRIIVEARHSFLLHAGPSMPSLLRAVHRASLAMVCTPYTDFLGYVFNGSDWSQRCWHGYVVHMGRIFMCCCALLQGYCLPAMVPRNSLVCSVVLGPLPAQLWRCFH